MKFTYLDSTESKSDKTGLEKTTANAGMFLDLRERKLSTIVRSVPPAPSVSLI